MVNVRDVHVLKENFHFRFNPELLPQSSALDKATELIQQYKAKLKQLEMKAKVGFDILISDMDSKLFILGKSIVLLFELR